MRHVGTILVCAAAVLCVLPLSGCAKDQSEKQAPAPSANAQPGTPVKKNLPGPNKAQGMQTPAAKPPGI